MSRKNIKLFLYGFLDRVEQINALSCEKRKYKDDRRKQIYRAVTLTNTQKNEIDKLFMQHYKNRVPYIWHRSYTAYTGRFDCRYIPEILYIPKFERYMNYDNALANVLEDKNYLYIFAKNANVNMPKRILSCQEGLYQDKDGNSIGFADGVKKLSDVGMCFAKPSVGTDSGKGCRVFDFQEGRDKLTGDVTENVLRELGNNFTIQERLVCHNSISKIYPGSVNTFRIMTYRWHDRIVAAPVIMRIGRGGSFLDNAHAGGIFIAVSNDGTLHSTAFTEFKEKYEMHPDTGVKFQGYKIDLLPKVIETAKKMHELLPTIGIINWDMTVDEKGNPVLIEANVNNGSIWLFQMAHGKGVFEENTEEVLRWIHSMDRMSYKERKVHHFGD